MTVLLDGKLVSPGIEGIFTLRRAPGNCHFNFAQDLNLSEQPPYSYTADSVHQSAVRDGQAYYSMPQLSANNCYDDSHLRLPLVKPSPPHGSGGSDEERPGLVSHLYSSITASGVCNEEYGSVRRNSLLVASPHSGSGLVLGDEEYESPVMPQGFVFQILILSTWGDPYYVGLNGLELYDQDGYKMRLTENSELIRPAVFHV